MLFSRVSVVKQKIIWVLGAGWDLGYPLFLLCLLFLFISLRVPYLYSMFIFMAFILFFIFPLFLGVFFFRLFHTSTEFFSSFVPDGTPLWISWFVCFAETLSYLIRPVVLMIRPFLNVSIGALAAAALGGLFFLSPVSILGLVVLFFYEIFVALVHWFIVKEILFFSVSH